MGKRRPLRNRTVYFAIDDEIIGNATTDARGWATLDLKNRVSVLVEHATADEYDAGFRYDGEFCSSMDSAGLSFVEVAQLP